MNKIKLAHVYKLAVVLTEKFISEGLIATYISSIINTGRMAGPAVLVCQDGQILQATGISWSVWLLVIITIYL